MSSVSTAAGAEARATGEALVLNRRVTIVGSVDFDGDVVLGGRIEGEVRCRSLQIAERGSVEGDIVAERVIVLGEAAGSIHANEIVLKAACNVIGEIYHRNLVLEDGCYFEGQSRRDNDPILRAAHVHGQA
jgi:cytoskeletal protein CcmA (bactofilin family)